MSKEALFTPRSPTRRGSYQNIIVGTIGIPFSTRFLVVLFVFMFTAFFVASAVLQYTNTEKVSGYLIPESGLIKIGIPIPGVVSEVFIKKNDVVTAGQKLFTIGRDTDSSAQKSAGNQLSSVYERQLGAALSQLSSVGESANLERGTIRQAIDSYRAIVAALEAQSARQQSLVKSLNVREEKIASLQKDRIATLEDLNQARSQYTQGMRELQQLQSQLIDSRTNLAKLEADLQLKDVKQRYDTADVSTRVEEIRSRQTRNDMEFFHVVSAPVAGKITKFDLQRGSAVAGGGQMLAELLPDADSNLEAEILVPSARVGFLHVGQQVNLSYDAFPVSNFGTFPGTLESISQNSFFPNELPIRVQNEQTTYYRATVRLNNDKAALEKLGDLHLKSGMTLTADVVLDRRSLLEWLLEPILRIRKRLFA